jgi:hypothetical protein
MHISPTKKPWLVGLYGKWEMRGPCAMPQTTNHQHQAPTTPHTPQPQKHTNNKQQTTNTKQT